MKLKELKSIFIVFGVFLLISGLLMLLIFFRDASYFYHNSDANALSFTIDGLCYAVVGLGVILLVLAIIKVIKFHNWQIILTTVLVIILAVLLTHFTLNSRYRFNSTSVFSAVVVAKDDEIEENNITVIVDGETIKLYGTRALVDLVDIGDSWGIVTYRHPRDDYSWGYIEQIDFPVKHGAIREQPGAVPVGTAMGCQQLKRN